VEIQRESCIPVAEVLSLIVVKASCGQAWLQGDRIPGRGCSALLLEVALNQFSVRSCTLEKVLQEESLKGAWADSPSVHTSPKGNICLLLQVQNRSSWIGDKVYMMNLMRQYVPLVAVI
jgi:hypothetical protein